MKTKPFVASTLLLLAPPAVAATITYADFASWSAAAGTFVTEDFESYPEQRLPVEGGYTVLDHFSIYNDEQGTNEWAGTSGLYRGSSWYAYPEIPDTMNLIISAEGSDPEDPYDGPLVIDAVFSTPIRAIALEYSWCEDEPGDCVFDGFVFDDPVTSFSLWKPRSLNHSWGAIDAVYFTPVPEPSTAWLLLLGLVPLRRLGARAR